MPFIHEEFLLTTPEAQRLYHEYAEGLPIVDYHCHLLPEHITVDQRWKSITQVWLGGDHYKWRAMRSNGTPERLCTGNATDWEKFEAYAQTLPYCLRNPLYHWSHLELARYFGITDLLGPDTARAIYDACNERIASPDFSARQLMKQSRVAAICTTDDPVDLLSHHRAIAADPSFSIQVRPTWRPDRAMAVEDPKTFNAYIDKLGEMAQIEIGDSYDRLLDALRKRHDFFHECGCRLSDHGLETCYAADYTDKQVRDAFEWIRNGAPLVPDAALAFKSAMLHEFAVMDAEKDWTQQLHFGAMRNNNRRMFDTLGPDTGFDSIHDLPLAAALSRFCDRLDRIGKLPKTILYNLNPKDNEVLATMLGNFQDGSIPGKMQFGSGWWFLDQEDGMRRQMEAVSQLGLLRRFVGMLTDSRSFLSYTRHEYFRRILCDLLGRDMATGRIPQDYGLVGAMVRDISYNNAARYFGFGLDEL